jgi:D-ribose pyranase
VEKITLATEIKEQNQAELEQINDIFKDTGVEVCFVPHEELKRQTKDCKAVIRMGETTPYANIILQSGCIFA